MEQDTCIKVNSAERFLERQSGVPSDLLEDAALPTLVIEHSSHSELLWTLRLTEFFGDTSNQFPYQPDVSWRESGDGMLSYSDRPVTADKATMDGTCSCQVRAAGDVMTFELSVTNRSNRLWPDCWGWLCLMHRWARAFQSNCELPAGDQSDPWVATNSLEAPLGRWLKWCPISASADVAHRIGDHQGARWQPHIQATQGAVRAWRIHGSRQQFIQMTSPEAIILGWSHGPCTDMGVYFGTLEAGETGHVTGKLEFLEKPVVPVR